MDPHTGEILALANWPTLQSQRVPGVAGHRPPQPRRPGSLRAGIDVQDRHGLGRARGEAWSTRRTDRRQPGTSSSAAGRSTTCTRTACCRSPTSSSSRATSARSRSGCGSDPNGWAATSAASGSDRRSRRDFRGESPGIVWNPARLDDSALASVSMGYQVGVTPLQMAAAVSSIANGGELIEPRVVRAVITRWPTIGGAAARCSAAPYLRRHRRRADRDHGRGRRARHGEGRADSGFHDRRQDRHGGQARQRPLLEVRLQRLVRRVRAVAQAGVHHHRRHRLAAATATTAASPRRSSSGSPRPRCATGRRADHQSPRRRSWSRVREGGAGSRAVRARMPRPAIADARSRRADVDAAICAGLSAREALRMLTRLGVAARMTGDGFVVDRSARRRATPIDQR